MYIRLKTSIHVETTKQAVSITSIPFSTYAATDMSIITYRKYLVYKNYHYSLTILWESILCKGQIHMAQVIKNLGQFAKALEPKIIATLEVVAEDTKREIDDYLQAYYDEYDPLLGGLLGRFFYQRTYQLRDCCKIGDRKSVV